MEKIVSGLAKFESKLFYDRSGLVSDMSGDPKEAIVYEAISVDSKDG